MAKIVQVSDKNFLGENREYTFDLMPANVGVRLFHENSGVISTFCSIAKSGLEGKAEIPGIVIGFSAIVEPSKFEEFVNKVLHDKIVEDPLENYAKLYYGFIANYGKTLTPLLEALEKQGDSSPKSETTAAN